MLIFSEASTSQLMFEVKLCKISTLFKIILMSVSVSVVLLGSILHSVLILVIEKLSSHDVIGSFILLFFYFCKSFVITLFIKKI